MIYFFIHHHSFSDGIVTVWDTPTQISRHSCKVGEGVSKLAVHPGGNLIYASTLDGEIKCLDLRTGNPVRELSGKVLLSELLYK